MGLGSFLKKSKIANIISDPGSTFGFGTNTRIGDWMNDLTGTTSAAKQSQQYALQSAAVANQYQKEFAQNAHQWEMADLQKAGINPILYAGGGAPAGSGNVNSAQMNASGHNPLEVASILSNILQQGKQNKQIEAQTKLDKANTAAQNANVAKTTAQIQEIMANIRKIEEETKRIQGGQASNVFGTNKNENPLYTNAKGIGTDILKTIITPGSTLKPIKSELNRIKNMKLAEKIAQEKRKKKGATGKW